MDESTQIKLDKYVQKLLKSKKAIVINDTMMHTLGYDNTRDFFAALGNWGYNSDFGRFSEATDTSVQSYIRTFLKDQYVEYN